MKTRVAALTFSFLMLFAALASAEGVTPVLSPADLKACAQLAQANAVDAKHDHRLVPDPGYLCNPAAEIVYDYEAGEGYVIHAALFLWFDPSCPDAMTCLTYRFLRRLPGSPTAESSYVDPTNPQAGPLGTLTPWKAVAEIVPTCLSTPLGCFPMLPPNGQIEDPWAQ